MFNEHPDLYWHHQLLSCTWRSTILAGRTLEWVVIKAWSKPLVKSFNFSTIRTLRGTLLKTSNTESSKPSCFATALRIASTSSTLCFSRSAMLDPRVKLALPLVDSSSHEPSKAARPVRAASKTGYYRVVSACRGVNTYCNVGAPDQVQCFQPRRRTSAYPR